MVFEQVKSYSVLSLFIFHAHLSSQEILFTEIMYDLVGSDSPNEFVELYNSSETDSLDITDWSIRDRSSTDEFINSGFGLKIPPLSFAILFENDYDFENGQYVSIIPENTILIKVDDSSIGNGLSASDSLYLQDSTGLVVENIGWEDWAQDGFSLERVRNHIGNISSNWIQSLDSLETPGSVNSVLPDSIDFSISSISISPEIISSGENTTIFGNVVNVGLNPAEPVLTIFIDGEYFTDEFLGTILELDTIDFELEIGPFNSGTHSIFLTILTEGDSNTTNNQDSINIGVRYQDRSIVMNEFMPQPSSGYPEFVEIVCLSTHSIDLADWRITDNNTGNNYSLISVIMDSGNYAVIASDSTMIDDVPFGIPYLVPTGGFPTLNNSGDNVRLFDPFNTLIDSLNYSADWELALGISQEKFFVTDSSHEQTNWAPSQSLNGHTVGALNSVTPFSIDGAIIQDEISYLPLIPNNSDSVTLSVPVLNSGVASFLGIVQVHYLNETISQTSFSSENAGDTIVVELNIGPFNSGFHELEIGIQIENDEDESDNSALDTVKVKYPFGAIMLNEFMSAPNNDQSEFIELISTGELNMIDWAMSDNHLTPAILDSFPVFSGDYIVILSDSAHIDLVAENSHISIPNNFPSLNNSADGIFLFDHTGSVIDSLKYDEGWPVVSERSSEKKRPSYESNASENWGIAEAGINQTPGFQNSQMILDIDGSILQDSIFYSPKPPQADSTVMLFIPIINLGIEPFSGTFSVEFEEEEISEGSWTILDVRDTIILESEIISPSPGVHSMTVILDISDDGNSENNIGTFSLAVRYPFGAVLFNEFFVLPDTAEFEFVEIVPQYTVNTAGWAIMDLSGRKGYFQDIILDRYDYCLVTDDSSFLDQLLESTQIIFPENGLPDLNNISETMFILDHTSSVIDSLHYDENWPTIKSRSTEKYRLNDISNNSKNWGISVGNEGKTPGVQNSLFFSELPPKGTIDLFPDPFSPDGDGIDDELTLIYSIPFNEASLRWEIIDMSGRIISRPYYNYQVGQNGELRWDGKRDNGTLSRIGIYVMKISFQDMASTKSWESAKTIILAKPL